MSTVTLNDDLIWVIAGLLLIVPFVFTSLGDWARHSRAEHPDLTGLLYLCVILAGGLGLIVTLVGLGHGFYVGVR